MWENTTQGSPEGNNPLHLEHDGITTALRDFSSGSPVHAPARAGASSRVGGSLQGAQFGRDSRPLASSGAAHPRSRGSRLGASPLPGGGVTPTPRHHPPPRGAPIADDTAPHHLRPSTNTAAGTPALHPRFRRPAHPVAVSQTRTSGTRPAGQAGVGAQVAVLPVHGMSACGRTRSRKGAQLVWAPCRRRGWGVVPWNTWPAAGARCHRDMRVSSPDGRPRSARCRLFDLHPRWSRGISGGAKAPPATRAYHASSRRCTPPHGYHVGAA